MNIGSHPQTVGTGQQTTRSTRLSGPASTFGLGMHRGAVASLWLTVLVCLAVLAPMAPAGAADTGSPARAASRKTNATKVGFGVVPATAHGLDARSLFSFGLTPGSVAFDHVAIVNYSTKKLDLDVYVTDALNSPEGGYALRAATEKPFDLGAWVVVGKASRSRTVSVPGRRKDGSPGRVILPVTITVPANASPGDHAAGIVASLTSLGKNPKGQNVKLEQRVAGRVYVRVNGPLLPSLIVTSLTAHFVGSSWPWKPGSVVVDYTVSNTGNLRMGFKPSLVVKGPLGLGSRSARDEPDAELLPGNSRTFHTAVRNVWPMLRLHVTAIVAPTAAIAAEPPEFGVIREAIDIVAVTWPVIVFLVLLVALLVFWVSRRIRRIRAGRGASIAGVPKQTRQTKQPVSNAARRGVAPGPAAGVRRSYIFTSGGGRIRPTLWVPLRRPRGH
jgi:hypothetical protein